MPGEEPVSQFCDGFKTLAVQSGQDNSTIGPSLLPLVGDAPSLLPDLLRSKVFLFPPDTGHLVFETDILLRISVLRI